MTAKVGVPNPEPLQDPVIPAPSLRSPKMLSAERVYSALYLSSETLKSLSSSIGCRTSKRYLPRGKSYHSDYLGDVELHTRNGEVSQNCAGVSSRIYSKNSAQDLAKSSLQQPDLRP